MNANTTPTFRDARREEVPAIARLLADDELGQTREASAADTDPAYFQAFDAIARDAGNRLIVAELDGTVVGCMQITVIPHLTFTGGTRLQIEGVRVDRTCRGRQVGAAMIAWAVAEARAQGCHLVQLTSNKSRDDALRFYRDQGFEPTHVGFKLYLA